MRNLKVCIVIVTTDMCYCTKAPQTRADKVQDLRGMQPVAGDSSSSSGRRGVDVEERMLLAVKSWLDEQLLLYRASVAALVL
jgi:hypothetical protein